MAADVLVLGAGIAGLAAAERLAAAGRRVLILEARDRLGGRIHTVDDPALGHPIELGAEFVHGRPAELVGLIRSRHGNRLCIGAAAYPEKHVECGNPAVDLANLKRKVDAGADFLVTQLFFDNRRYFEFVDNARAAGIRLPGDA